MSGAVMEARSRRLGLQLGALFYSPVDFTDASDLNTLMQVWCIGEINRWIKQRTRRPSCVLVEGTSMSWRSAARDLPDQKCQQLECRLCWSRQDSVQCCIFYLKVLWQDKTEKIWVDFEQRIIDRAANEWQNNCGLMSRLKDCTSMSCYNFDTAHCSERNTACLKD